MNTLLLQYESRILFERLQAELKPFKLDGGTKAYALEKSFLVCMAYQEELHSLLRVTEFENRKEEVQFFKYTKPKFLAEVEYRQRLLYAQGAGIDAGSNPEPEISHIKKLLVEYGDFVNYYHEGLTHNDNAWFIQGEMPLPTRLCVLPPETNPRFTSCRDRWIAGLIAVERYYYWLNQKM